MQLILEPLQYGFIQRALIASILIGLSCSMLGVYVVLRRISNIGHALTHSALPGIVIAFILGSNLFLGALGATLVTALLIGALSKDDKVYEDTATGMLPTIMFALGVMLISSTKSYRDMASMLFGNILAVTVGDLKLIGVIAAFIILIVLLFQKELKLFCVDRDYAKTIGINVDALRYLLLFLLSLSVVTGIQAVGTILTSALLIIPTASARLLTQRMGPLMLLSAFITIFSCVMGVYASYYFSFSSGAAIVLASAGCFIFAFGFRLLRSQT